jgi:hypothetical protein
VDWQQSLDGFQLDDQLIAHDEVDSVGALEADALVHDRYDLLLFEAKLAQHELARQTRFVRGFEESRPQRSVNFDACTNDFSRTIPKPSWSFYFLFHPIPSAASTRRLRADASHPPSR